MLKFENETTINRAGLTNVEALFGTNYGAYPQDQNERLNDRDTQ